MAAFRGVPRREAFVEHPANQGECTDFKWPSELVRGSALSDGPKGLHGAGFVAVDVENLI